MLILAAHHVISPPSRQGAPNPLAAPLLDPWDDAFNLWLDSRPSENTRRAYRTAWQAFNAFTAKPPRQVGRADVTSWIDHLRTHDASSCTIRQRLAAISSFYTFTNHTYTTVDPDGREHPLHAFNPAASVPLPKVSPYDKAIYLSPDEARAFLNAIPRHTFQGKRDYAIFLAYLATGRRNSEIRLLRWRDIDTTAYSPTTRSNSRIYYRWSGKGKHRRDECPLPVYNAILDFIQSSGRLKTIQPSDYIFIPLNHNASHFSPSPRHPFSPSPLSTPLSSRTLNSLVKKYARRALLDPRRITVHTLRHTAAMLRKEAGDDLESISSFLGHSNLSITQIYLHSVEGRHDTTWLNVEQLLGLSSDNPLPPGRGKLNGDQQVRPPRLRRRLSTSPVKN